MKILKPSDRPFHDWRDPNMRVFRYIKGQGLLLTVELSAEEATAAAELGMHDDVPDYQNDPTYSMRRRK
jgi:hypothetical protein